MMLDADDDDFCLASIQVLTLTHSLTVTHSPSLTHCQSLKITHSLTVTHSLMMMRLSSRRSVGGRTHGQTATTNEHSNFELRTTNFDGRRRDCDDTTVTTWWTTRTTFSASTLALSCACACGSCVLYSSSVSENCCWQVAVV